jgi:hypothetical protein
VYGHFAALDGSRDGVRLHAGRRRDLPAQEVLDAWTPEYADRILLNEADGETPWISWGGIFHKDLPKDRCNATSTRTAFNDDVLLWCDLIFSTLTPWGTSTWGA